MARNMNSYPSLSTALRVVIRDIVPKPRLPWVLNWLFLLFTFTIPFEAVDLGLGVTSSSFSLSKLTGLFFFVLYFLYYNPLLAQLSHKHSIPSPPYAFWWFLGYWTVYSLHGFFLPELFMPEFLGRLFTLLQLLVFFWIASNILEEKKLMRRVLFTYVVASALLAFGLLLHLPGFSGSELAGDIERSTIPGYDANYLATLWALAVVILIELCSYPYPAYRYLRLFLGLLAVPLLIGIMQTGSRAGIGALLIGFLVYLLPYWRSQHKWPVRLLALLSILATVYLMVNNPATMQRWQESFSERKFSGREQIFPAAIAMFSEHPFLGWQPGKFMRELGRRVYESLYTARTKDAHNLLLHLLLEVGLVGATPFLIGLWMCGQTAWKARSQHSSMLPLALFCTLLAASMSHPLLQYKPLWLVLALTSASVSIPTVGQVGRTNRLLIIRSFGSER